MPSKNSEAQKCANTLGLSSKKSREGNIDMNIVAKSDFNFKGKALVPVANISGTWLTSSDLAKALEYSNSRAVTMLYNKYAEEFSSGMTQVLEVSTSGNYRKKSACVFIAWCAPDRNVCPHSGCQRIPSLGVGYSGSRSGSFTYRQAVL